MLPARSPVGRATLEAVKDNMWAILRVSALLLQTLENGNLFQLKLGPETSRSMNTTAYQSTGSSS